MNLDLPQTPATMYATVVAVGASAAIALWGVASLPVATPPPLTTLEAATTIVAKTDKPTVDQEAKVVRTIPISRLPAPTVVAPLVLPDPAPQPAAAPTPTEAPPAKVAQYIMPVAPPSRPDICRKHGGYKEVRGRSWHCVYRRG